MNEETLTELLNRINNLEDKVLKLQQALHEHSGSGVAHMFPVKADIE